MSEGGVMIKHIKQFNIRKNKIKVILSTIATIVILSPILFNIAIMIINNFIAVSVKNDLKKLPIPENSELISSYSVAGKVVGNGNGMQYFGAILIQSELSLEELSEYYSSFDRPYIQVSIQRGNDIVVLDHGSHAFNVKYDNCYIVYDWGSANVILEQFDLRGH